MLFAVVISVALSVSTIWAHLQVSRAAELNLPTARPNLRMLSIVLMLLATHMFNAGLYAFAYAAGAQIFEIGALGGEPTVHALDYLYFSMVTYTSLGLGDVYPQEHLRFIAGVEAVNGLLLIAWSASVIFREANARRS